jgi:hypothetical protein
MAKETANSEGLCDQLRVEEYKILRGEIEQRSCEGRTMERYAMLVSAAVYGGFLLKDGVTQKGDGALCYALAWYLPPLFNFLAMLRWRETTRMMEKLASYIRRVEERNMGGGWEIFLEKTRSDNSASLVSSWYIVFWTACIVVPATMALIHTFGMLDDGAGAHVMHNPWLVSIIVLVAVGVVGVVALLLQRQEGCTLKACELRGRLTVEQTDEVPGLPSASAAQFGERVA